MRNMIGMYHKMGTSFSQAIIVWAIDQYYPTYLYRMSYLEGEPISEKQFDHIMKVCDKQHWYDQGCDTFGNSQN